MLYLEDYLEMIEHLPQELRDRFTEMRELDLLVQNNMDDQEKRVKALFNEGKKYPNEIPATLDGEFQLIRKEYYKILEDADEKVHLANQMYELVDKYLRRLDSELHKFKCELEADNKGITEVLEKRSLELDIPVSTTPMSSQQKENRYERYRPRNEKRRESSVSLNNSYSEKRQAITPTAAAAVVEGRHSSVAQSTPSSQSGMSYSLSHIGAGTAIAAAASQAIVATQQMQQGRRTASLKASYEAIHSVNEFGIVKELQGAAQTAIQAIQQQEHANNKKKQKKWTTTTSGGTSHASSANVPTTVHAILTNNAVSTPAPASPAVEVSTQNNEVTDGEWTYDPNEPRYCLCNQVSYGDMVACDNEDCPSEWFHCPCVGITAPPKGKWYCPQCTTSMRRRGGRKN